MTDIVERLRKPLPTEGLWTLQVGMLIDEAAAEIERLTEEVNALRLVATAHDAEVERLRTDNELLQADRNRWREMWGELDARAALEPKP